MDREDNIVSILTASYRQAFASRGVSEPQAMEMAQRAVNALLEVIGGRKWYLPKQASFEADARASRDEAIRQAHRRSVPMRVTCRTFRISTRTYYRVLKAS